MADTSVDAADRPALERLVRYLLRPLISADRLTARSDGRVESHFRRPDPSGRTSWVTDGPTGCRRLATLIPPRRSHTTRFHGVLSSAHVVDGVPVDDAPEDPLLRAYQLLADIDEDEDEDEADEGPPRKGDPDADLVLAAYFGDVPRAKRALAAGASPDARQKGTQQPALLLACANDHLKIVRLLLDHGADANASVVAGRGRSATTVSALDRPRPRARARSVTPCAARADPNATNRDGQIAAEIYTNHGDVVAAQD